MAEIYVEGDVRGGGTGDSADAVPPQSTRMIAAAVQGAFFIGGIGFVLLPFVVWIVMRGRNVFVAHHAKQAFLSQLSVFVLFALSCMLGAALDDAYIAVGLCFLVGIPWCLASVYGVVKALSGERWHFPGLGWAV